MGSLTATRSRSSTPIGFSTAEFTPNSGIVVARCAFLRLRQSVLASVRAGLAFSGEADPPLRTLERVVLNALASNGPKTFGLNFTTRGRWPWQRRGDAERARRKFPA